MDISRKLENIKRTKQEALKKEIRKEFLDRLEENISRGKLKFAFRFPDELIFENKVLLCDEIHEEFPNFECLISNGIVKYNQIKDNLTELEKLNTIYMFL